MPAPDDILARTAGAYRDAIAAYQRTHDARAFQRAMQEALARSHTAATIKGLADRDGKTVTDWLAGRDKRAPLPQEERALLRNRLASQVGYLQDFVDALPGMTGAQAAARAALYAASAKSSYWDAWAGKDLDCTPGSCPACLSRCRCVLERRGNGIYWTGPGDAHSCSACRGRIGQRMD